MLSSQDAANYFLILVDRGVGDTITALKLQKLLYFAQGVSLALLDRPLFDAEIQAREHGVIVRDLYKNFGNFGNLPVPAPAEIDFDLYTDEEKELICKIHNTYGERSASHLGILIRQHPVWRNALAMEDKILDKRWMQEFFKTIIRPDFLSITEKEKQQIITAEDEWWMNYDTGIPAEDITNQILASYRPQD